MLTVNDQQIDLRSVGIDPGASTFISVNKMAIHHDTGAPAIMTLSVTGSTHKVCNNGGAGKGYYCDGQLDYLFMLPLTSCVGPVVYHRPADLTTDGTYIEGNKLNVSIAIDGVAYDFHEDVPLELTFRSS
jgi:hypothetical protein